MDKMEKRIIPEIPDELSEKCTNFIKRCLVYDKDKRPSAQELLEDPFITDIYNTN